jgi:hypothetical protein
MNSAFGVDHGEVSKRGGGGLKALLSPYKGAVPKAPGIQQLNPANRPQTMKLRNARRQAGAGRTPRPGEAMR